MTSTHLADVIVELFHSEGLENRRDTWVNKYDEVDLDVTCGSNYWIGVDCGIDPDGVVANSCGTRGIEDKFWLQRVEFVSEESDVLTCCFSKGICLNVSIFAASRSCIPQEVVEGKCSEGRLAKHV